MVRLMLVQSCEHLANPSRPPPLNASSNQGKTMLLGVDSLDATKGLVHKFLALEEMFGMEPALADRVNFVQVSYSDCLFIAYD